MISTAYAVLLEFANDTGFPVARIFSVCRQDFPFLISGTRIHKKMRRFLHGTILALYTREGR
jgi:hypothetical protein